MGIKLNRLDTHDRYLHFTKQNFNISECVDDLIKKRPFGDNAFYIFAHARTDDDGVTKRLIWQPRLTRPRAQTNSMLFKAYPLFDHVKIIWIIPQQELWSQFKRGNVCQNDIVMESIDAFLHRKEELEAKEDDDLSDDAIDRIYKQISGNANPKPYKKI